MIIQLRMMGSAIGVAVSGSVVNSYLTSNLKGLINESELKTLLRNLSIIPMLPGNVQAVVRETFGEAYAVFVEVIVGLSVAQVLAVAMMWKRPQLQLLH